MTQRDAETLKEYFRAGQKPQQSRFWDLVDSVVLGNVVLGQEETATGPVGTIVGKLPVYDQAGTLLGYLPLYGSIA